MTKIRVARPTDDLERLIGFYRDGLGLKVLASFEDHAGFDGVVLGEPGEDYHLEFTHERGAFVGSAPSQDHPLVFYFSQSRGLTDSPATWRERSWSTPPTKSRRCVFRASWTRPRWPAPSSDPSRP